MAISTAGGIKGWYLEGATAEVPAASAAASDAANIATAASGDATAAAGGSSSVPGSAAAAPRWPNFLLNIYCHQAGRAARLQEAVQH